MDARRVDRRPLLPALRRADGALADERLAPKAVRRIERRLERELAMEPGEARMPRWVPMATFVGGAALVFLVLGLGRGERRRTASEPAPVTVVRGLDCERHDGRGMQLSGVCDVKVGAPAMSIHTTDAELGLQGQVADLRDGHASFDVQPAHDDPVRVRVPGGEIVVVGTRFDVVVDGNARSGWVHLHEGHLRFEADDGDVATIHAGERFEFAATAVDAEQPVAGPDPAAVDPAEVDPPAADPSEVDPAAVDPAAADVAPNTAPADARVRSGSRSTSHLRSDSRARSRSPARSHGSPARPRAEASTLPEPGKSADTLVAEVAAARRRGDYREAVAVLRAALTQRWDRRTEEVLSYELGTILSSHLDAPAEACSHWASHRRRFGEGRYGTQIARAESKLGCAAAADPAPRR